jgi:phage terminase large subunit-like protein
MRLFGWRRADGRRRFIRVYLEIAKKNGKSTLFSCLAVYLIVGEDEGAPEVYLNAVDREQASMIYEEAARMVEASPELAKRLTVLRSNKRILEPVGYGVIRTNSADAPSKDGVNASAVLFDELHRLKTRELWDVMEYAGASREQPLTLSITTAGEDTEGVWHEQRDYSDKVNDGVIADTTHLGVVYRALDSDDLDSPAIWRKANPSLGLTISEEDFAREWEEAKLVPTKRSNFLRLRLCIVAAGPQNFIDVSAWNACDHPAVVAVDGPSFAGLDLSATDDLTALVEIRGNTADGFDVRADFWLPRDGITDLESRHQQPYREWARQGLITLTEGPVIDYGFVRAQINKLASRGNLARIMADQYNAYELTQHLLNDDGLPVEYIRQGFLSLSGPTKELLRLIMGRKIRHGGNPILRWHASNAVVVSDAAGNIKLHKEKSKKKIDGLAALVNAVAAATTGEDLEPSVYESRGPIFMSY